MLRYSSLGRFDTNTGQQAPNNILTGLIRISGPLNGVVVSVLVSHLKVGGSSPARGPHHSAVAEGILCPSGAREGKTARICVDCITLSYLDRSRKMWILTSYPLEPLLHDGTMVFFFYF